MRADVSPAPQEDAAAFTALETALLAELAPDGSVQAVLAQRVVSAAWRLARADRMEAEALAYRSYSNASAGLALIRDGNGTRSFDTLMRYRGAAMAEFQRALRALQALQAPARAADPPAPPARRRGPRPGARRNQPGNARPIKGLATEATAAPQLAAAEQPRPAAAPMPTATTPQPSCAISRRRIHPCEHERSPPAPARAASDLADRNRPDAIPAAALIAGAERTRNASPEAGLGVPTEPRNAS